MPNLESLFEEFVKSLLTPEGKIARSRFASEAEVAEKVAEFRILLSGLNPEASSLIEKFENDPGLHSPSLSTRLKTLVLYGKSIVKLLRAGIIHGRGTLVPAPDFSGLTGTIPELQAALVTRWKEIQIARNVGLWGVAIMLMGSLIEALLLAQAMHNPQPVQRARSRPRTPGGGEKPVQEWNLQELCAVAYELGWIHTAPREIPPTLLKYRSLVHPWEQLSLGAELNEKTVSTGWKTLQGMVEDLLRA